jgi:hypothetical protein
MFISFVLYMRVSFFFFSFLTGRKELLQTYLSRGNADEHENELPSWVEDYVKLQAKHQRALVDAGWREKDCRVKEEVRAGQALQSLTADRDELRADVTYLRNRVQELSDDNLKIRKEVCEKTVALKAARNRIYELQAIVKIHDPNAVGPIEDVLYLGDSKAVQTEVSEEREQAINEQPESEELLKLREQVASHEATLEEMRSAHEAQLTDLRKQVLPHGQKQLDLQNSLTTTKEKLVQSERLRTELIAVLQKVSPEEYNKVVARHGDTFVFEGDEEGRARTGFSEIRDSRTEVLPVPPPVLEREATTAPPRKLPLVLSILDDPSSSERPTAEPSSVVRMSPLSLLSAVPAGQIPRGRRSPLPIDTEKRPRTPASPHTPLSTPPRRSQDNIGQVASVSAQRGTFEGLKRHKENEKQRRSSVLSQDDPSRKSPRRALEENSHRTTATISSNVQLSPGAQRVCRSPSVVRLEGSSHQQIPSIERTKSVHRKSKHSTDKRDTRAPRHQSAHVSTKQRSSDARSHRRSEKERNPQHHSKARPHSSEKSPQYREKKHSSTTSVDFRAKKYRDDNERLNRLQKPF